MLAGGKQTCIILHAAPPPLAGHPLRPSLAPSHPTAWCTLLTRPPSPSSRRRSSRRQPSEGCLSYETASRSRLCLDNAPCPGCQRMTTPQRTEQPGASHQRGPEALRLACSFLATACSRLGSFVSHLPGFSSRHRSAPRHHCLRPSPTTHPAAPPALVARVGGWHPLQHWSFSHAPIWFQLPMCISSRKCILSIVTSYSHSVNRQKACAVVRKNVANTIKNGCAKEWMRQDGLCWSRARMLSCRPSANSTHDPTTWRTNRKSDGKGIHCRCRSMQALCAARNSKDKCLYVSAGIRRSTRCCPPMLGALLGATPARLVCWPQRRRSISMAPQQRHQLSWPP